MPLAIKNNLELDFLLPEDAVQIGPLTNKAFHSYEYMRHMLPKSEEMINGWNESTMAALRDSFTIGLKVTDINTGKIVSSGRWVRPYAEDTKIESAAEQPGHEEGRWTDQFMQTCDEELATAVFGAFDRNHAKFMELKRHWYMELLVTDPDYKGQGAASLILQYGLNLADVDNLPCYIDATPEGKPLYERLGWELSYYEDFQYGMRYYFGIRPAQNS